MPMKWRAVYLKLAIRPLWRARAVAAVAVVCIATGIAALVAMDLLAAMTSATFDRDARMLLGADLIVSPVARNPDTIDIAQVEALKAQGTVIDYTSTIWHQVWAKSSSGGHETVLFLRGIEPNKYPLYGGIEVLRPIGHSLAELLALPDAVVLSENALDRLGLQLGDPIWVGAQGGRSYVATVQGIVAPVGEGTPNVLLMGYAFVPKAIAYDVLGVAEERVSRIYIRTKNPASAEALAAVLRAELPNAEIQTAGEIVQQNMSLLASQMTRALRLFGLLGLLIAMVGIANTAQVLTQYQRRQLAIMKVLGLQSRQITLVLVCQSAFLGLIGAILGDLLGITISRVAQHAAERFLSVPLSWGVNIPSLAAGLAWGVGLTSLMGGLPVISAARVRPQTILRPEAESLSHIRPLFSISWMIVSMGLVGSAAAIMLNSLRIGLAFAYGLLLLFAVISAVLNGVAYIISRLPAFGRSTLRVVLRDIGRQRKRVALSLLTVSFAIFTLSTVLLVSQSVKAIFTSLVQRELKADLQVLLVNPDQAGALRTWLEEQDEILTIAENRMTSVRLTYINDQEASPYILERVPDLRESGVFSLLSRMAGRDLAHSLTHEDIAVGRDLSIADAEQDKVLVVDGLAQPLGIGVGDRLTFEADGHTFSLEVVGIIRLGNTWVRLDGGFVAPAKALANAVPDAGVRFDLKVDPDQLDSVRTAIRRNWPDAFVAEQDTLVPLMEATIDRYRTLPLLVSGLSLLIGMAVIGNSALAMVQARTREIAILKSLGVGRRHLLAIVLGEHAFIAGIGGLLGVGLAASLTQSLTALLGAAVVPDVTVLVGLIILAIGISLPPTFVAVWHMTGQQPLTLLRLSEQYG